MQDALFHYWGKADPAYLRSNFAIAVLAEPDKEYLLFVSHHLGKLVEAFQGQRPDASQVSRGTK